MDHRVSGDRARYRPEQQEGSGSSKSSKAFAGRAAGRRARQRPPSPELSLNRRDQCGAPSVRTERAVETPEVQAERMAARRKVFLTDLENLIQRNQELKQESDAFQWYPVLHLVLEDVPGDQRERFRVDYTNSVSGGLLDGCKKLTDLLSRPQYKRSKDMGVEEIRLNVVKALCALCSNPSTDVNEMSNSERVGYYMLESYNKAKSTKVYDDLCAPPTASIHKTSMEFADSEVDFVAEQMVDKGVLGTIMNCQLTADDLKDLAYQTLYSIEERSASSEAGPQSGDNLEKQVQGLYRNFSEHYLKRQISMRERVDSSGTHLFSVETFLAFCIQNGYSHKEVMLGMTAAENDEVSGAIQQFLKRTYKQNCNANNYSQAASVAHFVAKFFELDLPTYLMDAAEPMDYQPAAASLQPVAAAPVALKWVYPAKMTSTLSSDDLVGVLIDLSRLPPGQWHTLALTLGLLANTCDTIEMEYPRHTNRQHTEILSKWLGWHDNVTKVGMPSWMGLTQALDTIGEPQLAAKIREKHGAYQARSYLDAKPESAELLCLKYQGETGLKRLFITEQLSANWRNLAIALHFDQYVIDAVEMNSAGKAESACRDILTKWFQEEHIVEGVRPCTWRELLEVLRITRNGALANSIESILAS